MQRPITLALVDVPNIVIQFAEVTRNRPNWHALLEWLRVEAGGTELEAWAYLNQERAPIAKRFEQQEHLRFVGFKTYMNYKREGNPDDVDDLMVAKLYQVWDTDRLAKVIIVSHDRNNFAHEVRELELAHIPCTVVGFGKRMGRRYRTLPGSLEHRFVSVMSIDGLVHERVA
ncbi:NYN domain-containing protein [bacterium]|nr:NYN domain-containing protein [bacterium]